METKKAAQAEAEQEQEKIIPAIQPELACLNCGDVLHGHYCSSCGQKNEDLHEPFWKLFADAFADFWHFDSKLLHTIYPLLFKPGFLTREYMAGRRVRFVHPIRLYFFLSVIFFVFYFSFSKQSLIEQNLEFANGAKRDSVIAAASGKPYHRPQAQDKKGTNNSSGSEVRDTDSILGFNRDLPRTIPAYEDSLRKLPKDSMPGFLQQLIDKKSIEAREKGDREVVHEIVETANHNLPKIMFVLLPVFALILKLLYLRRKIFFVDHAIFSLHFHAFAFIIFFLGFAIMSIFPALYLGNWMILLLLVYVFFALRNLYGQSKRKTFLKVFLLLISYSVFIGIAALVLIIYSAIVF